MENIFKENIKPINIECRVLKNTDVDSLSIFFDEIMSNNDNELFCPHPFTKEYAHKICNYSGLDVYCAVFGDKNILGYGMLRGWDEGFEIPSLGIAISRSARGIGLGKMFMLFLHSFAKCRGSKYIRLTVYDKNIIAKNLYNELGYSFKRYDENSAVGILEL